MGNAPPPPYYRKAIAGIVMGGTGIAVGAILLAVNLLLFGFSFTSPVTGLPSPTT